MTVSLARELGPKSLKCGNYRIEEVRAPDGYTQNTQYVEIKVDKNTAYQMDSVSGDAIITVTYENHPVKGKLVIHKSGETLKSFKKDFVYEEASLEGAEFEIYAAEDIFTPDHQVDEQGNRHVIYAKDTLVKTVTTNKNGEAVIKDLPLGKYRVKETKATSGFVLNPDSQSFMEKKISCQAGVYDHSTGKFRLEKIRTEEDRENILYRFLRYGSDAKTPVTVREYLKDPGIQNFANYVYITGDPQDKEAELLAAKGEVTIVGCGTDGRDSGGEQVLWKYGSQNPKDSQKQHMENNCPVSCWKLH